MDLEAIREKWLRVCGQCDAGVYGAPCTHPSGDYRPVMLELVTEVERLRTQRAEIARQAAESHHMVVDLSERLGRAERFAEEYSDELERLREALEGLP